MSDLEAENEKQTMMLAQAVAELEEATKYTMEKKAQQLMQRIVFQGVAAVFQAWKGYVESLHSESHD
eukprot:SAG11_NODE_19288_length_470_cov_0.695418_1_plen_66_part_10